MVNNLQEELEKFYLTIHENNPHSIDMLQQINEDIEQILLSDPDKVFTDVMRDMEAPYIKERQFVNPPSIPGYSSENDWKGVSAVVVFYEDRLEAYVMHEGEETARVFSADSYKGAWRYARTENNYSPEITDLMKSRRVMVFYDGELTNDYIKDDMSVHREVYQKSDRAFPLAFRSLMYFVQQREN